MISDERPWLLLVVVSGAGILALLSFALWPVFLTTLGPAWGFSNADIGWVSGAYFAGYLLATPILVGLTDRVDARLVFLGGCGFSVAGCLLFAMTAHDFWSASGAWAVVGSGLAGTYMPGLQILNARLDEHHRIRAVPWYTACFGIGTGGSFALMGWLLMVADVRTAALLAAGAALIAGLVVLSCVGPKASPTAPTNHRKRHPLDLRPAFQKPVAMGYIFAYGTHTYELFAYRTWSFALLLFMASQSAGKIGVGIITAIVSLITVSGMIASLVGASLCLRFGRHRVIASIGIASAALSVLVAISLHSGFWPVVIMLWAYNACIMLDSGSLTTGTVEAGDATDRGALLAVHSMIGFGGGALGGPIIGYVLDHSGGANALDAWMWALPAMGTGSAIVFLIQFYFWRLRRP